MTIGISEHTEIYDHNQVSMFTDVSAQGIYSEGRRDKRWK